MITDYWDNETPKTVECETQLSEQTISIFKKRVNEFVRESEKCRINVSLSN